jgi:hypothetical protein
MLIQRNRLENSFDQIFLCLCLYRMDGGNENVTITIEELRALQAQAALVPELQAQAALVPELQAQVAELQSQAALVPELQSQAALVPELQAQVAVAQEAARIASVAARQNADVNRAAAEANIPWYEYYAFAHWIPYLKLSCKAQARLAESNTYIW